MNILLINHYAGSPQYGMEFRPYYLAKEWVRLGHNVQIHAASYSHVRAVEPVPTNSPAPSIWLEEIDGIQYHWYSTPSYSGNGLARVMNIANFLLRAAFNSKNVLNRFKPDVVIASSTYPMDIWLASFIARKVGAKLVFELHDLWPLSLVEIGGMSARHPFIKLCQVAENFAYQKSDLVVSMLPCVTEYAISKGLPSERLTVVPNGFSKDDFESSEKQVTRPDLQNCIDKIRAGNKSLVAYTGSHGLPNALDTLLDAAGKLRGQPVQFVLVGSGHEKERLLKRVQAEGLDNVQMFDPIPKAQINSFLEYADMAYLGAPKHPLYHFGVSPNKLTDYMMACVPILFAIEAGNDPVTEAGCGISISSENSDALKDGILKIAAKTSHERRIIGCNGKRYALKYHSYDMLAKSFMDSINQATIRL